MQTLNILALDKRWKELENQGGIIDISFDHPSTWPHKERGDQAYIKVGEDQLTSELCRHDDKRFLRCVISLNIRGTDETVDIATWAFVAQDDFYSYLEAIENQTPIEKKQGFLANELDFFAEHMSPIELDFSVSDQRPRAHFHALNDISLEDLLKLYDIMDLFHLNKVNNS